MLDIGKVSFLLNIVAKRFPQLDTEILYDKFKELDEMKYKYLLAFHYKKDYQRLEEEINDLMNIQET